MIFIIIKIDIYFSIISNRICVKALAIIVIMTPYTVVSNIPTTGRYAGVPAYTAGLTNGLTLVGFPGKRNVDVLKSITLKNKVQQNGPFNVNDDETITLYNRKNIETATQDFNLIFGGVFLYAKYIMTKDEMFGFKKTDETLKCKFEMLSDDNMQVSARFDVHEKIRKMLSEKREQERLLEIEYAQQLEREAQEQEEQRLRELSMSIQNIQDGMQVDAALVDGDIMMTTLKNEISNIKSSDSYGVATMICNVRSGTTYDRASCGCALCRISLLEKELERLENAQNELQHEIQNTEGVVEVQNETEDSESKSDNDDSLADDDDGGNFSNLSTKKNCDSDIVYHGSVEGCTDMVVWEDLALTKPPTIIFDEKDKKVTNIIPATGYNCMECYAIVCGVTIAGYWCGARMFVNGKMEVVRVFFSTLERLRLGEGDIVLVTGVQFGVGVSCNILGRITKKIVDVKNTLPKNAIDEFLEYQVFDMSNGVHPNPKLYEYEKEVEEYSFEFEEPDESVFKNEIDAKRARRAERTKKRCIHQEQCEELEQTFGVCPLCPNGINRADSWKKFLQEAVGLEGIVKDESIDLREIRRWGKMLGWNLESQIHENAESDDDGFDNRDFVLKMLETDSDVDDDLIQIDNSQVKIEKIDTVGLKKAHGGKRDRKKATKGRYESRAYTRGEENVDALEKKARRSTKRGNNKKGGQTFIGGKASIF